MIDSINFQKPNGLIPAIIQDFETGEVLMLGYMNVESFKKTIKEGYVYFWSRKRKKLWLKGETSGNKLKVKEIKTDCDKDALVIQVEAISNNVCHKGYKSCFYQKLI